MDTERRRGVFVFPSVGLGWCIRSRACCVCGWVLGGLPRPLAVGYTNVQAAEEVFWAYDFRFSPGVFWYPIIFVFIYLFLEK